MKTVTLIEKSTNEKMTWPTKRWSKLSKDEQSKYTFMGVVYGSELPSGSVAPKKQLAQAPAAAPAAKDSAAKKTDVKAPAAAAAAPAAKSKPTGGNGKAKAK